MWVWVPSGGAKAGASSTEASPVRQPKAASALEALQGLWGECDRRGNRRGKEWKVHGSKAAQQLLGGREGQRAELRLDDRGDVIWGSGKYVLSSPFTSGDSTASWYTGSKLAFTWIRLDSENSEHLVDPNDVEDSGPSDGAPPMKSDEICKFFAKSGWCKYGDGCKHSHATGAGTHASGTASQSSEMCQFFVKFGWCKYGNGCKHSHVTGYDNGTAVYSAEMCDFFAKNGYCKYGDFCKHSHATGLEHMHASEPASQSGEMCKFFAMSGWCRHGDACRHSHARGETRSGQLEALQGAWLENDSRLAHPKAWLVAKDKALLQVEGVTRKTFPLTSDKNRNVIWGSGQYVLDSSFESGDSVVAWYSKDKLGAVWTRQEAGEVVEKRIDPSDRKAYTLLEMKVFYDGKASSMPKLSTVSYWLSCKRDPRTAKQSASDWLDYSRSTGKDLEAKANPQAEALLQKNETLLCAPPGLEQFQPSASTSIDSEAKAEPQAGAYEEWKPKMREKIHLQEKLDTQALSRCRIQQAWRANT